MADNRALGAEQETTESHARPEIPSKEELKNLPPNGGENWNRLVFEDSPYLLQHAANPVDWYPWGEAAFKAAKEQDKPIFLSIGYSTCHWCHVMEHESFEDPEVAELMNKYFINIKVDREERPDIDHIYMQVCQAMTGSGGWPLTVVMTPDLKPFFAGTYYPKEGAFRRPGMMDLLPQLHNAWETKRDQINQSADSIVEYLEQASTTKQSDNLGSDTLQEAYMQLRSRYDSRYGGFGSAPKFPTPHNLSFMLRYYKRSDDPQALKMVEHTIREMRRGGVFDQIGFGFHRYSTDPMWLVPHFEKMLYDQALMAIASLETYQAGGDEEFAEIAREIFTYVLRDMTSPEGGFYSAEDADSEGEEGLFYLWTPEEVKEVLGEEEGKFFNEVFNIVEGGNFREEATQQPTGRNIPHLTKSFEQLAEEHDMSLEEFEKRIEENRKKLFDVREKRIHPLKDDKILTDWNGLMIAALARGGQVLHEPRYTNAAQKAADFVLANLRRDDGRLLKRYRQGEADLPGLLEDYAFFTWGLIELYEATMDVKYLKEAVELNEQMLEMFWDDNGGGLYMTRADAEHIIVRSKEVYDGAIPSGNSVAAYNLIRLNRMTAREDYAKKVEQIMRAFSDQVRRMPSAFTVLMIALDFTVGPSHEIVIAGRKESEDTQALLEALRQPFVPNKVVLHRPPEDDAPIVSLAPFTEYQTSKNGSATAYVCQDFSCQAPTTEAEKMLELLKSN